MAVVARCELILKASATQVFRAFVEPEWLERYWLKKASGPLRAGGTAQWRFLVPGASETVTVTQFVRNRHVGFDWSDGKHVDIGVAAWRRGLTRVTVEVTGFRGAAAKAAEEAIAATEGFTIVLCDLKALLESGASANLVRDKAKLIAAGDVVNAAEAATE